MSNQKEIHSTPTRLFLQEVKAESFAGIHKGQDIVVYMDPEKPIVELAGDQGTGKSSLLSLVRYLMGGTEADNSVNSIDNDRRGSAVFTKDGQTYQVKVTKSGFSLFTLTNTGEGVREAKLGKPKDELKKLVGPIGTNPNFLREKSGGEQVEYLRSLVNIPEEAKEKEKELSSKYQRYYNSRRDVNKELKRLRGNLVGTGMFSWKDEKQKAISKKPEYDEADKKFAASIEEREQEVTGKYKEAQERKTEYEAKQKEQQETEEANAKISIEIEELERKLAAKIKERAASEYKLQELTAYIDNNTDVIEEYQQAYDEFLNLGNEKAEKVRFEQVKKDYQDFQQKEKDRIEVVKNLSEAESEIEQFNAAYTPTIPGLTVYIPKEYDEAEEREKFFEEHALANPTEDQFKAHLEELSREGLWYKGHKVTELCESEIAELAVQLWRQQGVNLVLIENITSYGSAAIEWMNWFADNGGLIFASKMERQKTKLEINFLRAFDE